MREPTSSTNARELTERTVRRRAIEVVNWAVPAVVTDLMLQSVLRDVGAQMNQIVYYSELPSWKNQTLTPNPDSLYFMPFFSTKNGPMVLEIPPAIGGSITGSIMDIWQIPLEDVGPAGADAGKGGQYLILPPQYDGVVPDGYLPLPSGNYTGYALLRSILKSRSELDVSKAVAYGKQIKLYPFSQAAAPPDTIFVDALNVEFNGVIPYDVRFFESVNRVIQTEPWLDRDRIMIDFLKSLGIERGTPFAPNSETSSVLVAAAQEARARFDYLYETLYEPYNAGTHWFLPVSKEMLDGVAGGFTQVDHYPIDARGTIYYCAFSGVKHMGSGQFYLFETRDKAGDPLNGSESYRLTVPPNPPVKQYWSVVLYDFETHALIRDTRWSSRSSQSPGLRTERDGSVNIFFGPEAPDGEESNWVPTMAGGRFEALFRFYGPTPPLFDKTWILPDIARIGSEK